MSSANSDKRNFTVPWIKPLQVTLPCVMVLFGPNSEDKNFTVTWIIPLVVTGDNIRLKWISFPITQIVMYIIGWTASYTNPKVTMVTNGY